MRARRVVASVASVTLVAGGVLLGAPTASAAGNGSGGPPLATDNFRDATLTETVRYPDGSVRTTVSEYDGQGRLLTNSYVTQDGPVVIGSGGETYTYNTRGQLLTSVTVTDGDGEGPARPNTSTFEYAYSPRGQVTSTKVSVDQDSDGAVDYTITYPAEFDPRGNAIRTLSEFDADNDGVPESISTTTKVFDNRGKLIEERQESDDQATLTSPDYADVATYQYDAQGRVTAFTLEIYSNGELMTVSTVTTVYDQRGNAIREDYVVEFLSPAPSTTTIVTERVFNAKGQVVSRTQSTDADGSAGFERVETTTLAYDSRGNIVLQDAVVVADDGESRNQNESTYDAQGRLVLSIDRIDVDGVGGWDQTVREETTFDNRGRLVSETTETDSQISVTSYVYTATTKTITTIVDVGKDGLDVSTTVTTVAIS